jgi:dienelactone hydrolase
MLSEQKWRVVMKAGRTTGVSLILGAALALGAFFPGQANAGGGQVSPFDSAVNAVLALPYQPAYVPTGFDSAFAAAMPPVANTAPAQDYTTGSIPGSPDSPSWPINFKQVAITSADGAKVFGELAMMPGDHPGVVVVHGFNTHGYQSVIRWAAMLAANGYDVLAADQRDFSFEYGAGFGYPRNLQTFGWKESQDVLAAGRYLRSQKGVGPIGIAGFSEGAQNSVLALSQDSSHLFSAGITFSGPADQDTQIYSTGVPAGCRTPNCTYPVTDALIALVVPPNSYTDPCSVLRDAGTYYGVTPYSILGRESAMHAQTAVRVPLLNFYSNDDSLVSPVNAELMAAYNSGSQRTILIQHGEHAYYFDRWWQQMAILTYFHGMLPAGKTAGSARATVNQTPGGSALTSQLVPIPSVTRGAADAMLAPYICDTSQPSPG